MYFSDIELSIGTYRKTYLLVTTIQFSNEEMCKIIKITSFFPFILVVGFKFILDRLQTSNNLRGCLTPCLLSCSLVARFLQLVCPFQSENQITAAEKHSIKLHKEAAFGYLIGVFTTIQYLISCP